MVSHTLLHTECPGDVNTFVSILERKGYWEGELDHTTRNGQRITVESRMVLVRQAERPYVLETNRDITERLRIGEELRQANDELETRRPERTETRLRQMVESAPNGMVMINPEGKIVLVNAQTEKLFGYSRDELLGQSRGAARPGTLPNQTSGLPHGLLRQPRGASHGRGPRSLRPAQGRQRVPVEIGLNPIKTEEGLDGPQCHRGHHRTQTGRSCLASSERRAESRGCIGSARPTAS